LLSEISVDDLIRQMSESEEDPDQNVPAITILSQLEIHEEHLSNCQEKSDTLLPAEVTMSSCVLEESLMIDDMIRQLREREDNVTPSPVTDEDFAVCPDRTDELLDGPCKEDEEPSTLPVIAIPSPETCVKHLSAPEDSPNVPLLGDSNSIAYCSATLFHNASSSENSADTEEEPYAQLESESIIRFNDSKSRIWVDRPSVEKISAHEDVAIMLSSRTHEGNDPNPGDISSEYNHVIDTTADTSLSLETNEHDECRDSQIDLDTYWKDTEYTCLYFSLDESVEEDRQPNVRRSAPED
jgi:hypothetical protein